MDKYSVGNVALIKRSICRQHVVLPDAIQKNQVKPWHMLFEPWYGAWCVPIDSVTRAKAMNVRRKSVLRYIFRCIKCRHFVLMSTSLINMTKLP